MPRRKSLIWSIDKNVLQNLLDSSTSYTDVLKKLGFNTHSGNHRTLNKRIQDHELCINKLNINRKQHYKNMLKKRRTPNSKIFIKNSTYNNNVSIKKRLQKDYNIAYLCQLCGVGDLYNNKPLNLQLDHINGVNNDNRIENLRFLCPNCHSQTSNFSGRNAKKEIVVCYCKCGLIKTAKSITCRVCSYKSPKNKKFDIDKNDLIDLVCFKKIPFTTLAKEFGVSDNAVRKRCLKYNINPKTRTFE
jgi:5-methylcytosine-specific restriction endonuclease McrA